VFVSSDSRRDRWGEGAEKRVRTVVAPVEASWLGQHVLYLEEFLHDDPDVSGASCCWSCNLPSPLRWVSVFACIHSKSRSAGSI